jgi:hypothetical protein
MRVVDIIVTNWPIFIMLLKKSKPLDDTSDVYFLTPTFVASTRDLRIIIKEYRNWKEILREIYQLTEDEIEQGRRKTEQRKEQNE